MSVNGAQTSNQHPGNGGKLKLTSKMSEPCSEVGSEDANTEKKSEIIYPEELKSKDASCSSQGVESISASLQGVEPISASSPDVGSKHVISEIESIKTCLEEVKSKEATSSQEVEPSISVEVEPTSASSPEVGSKEVNPELESEITNPESSSHEVGSISASLEPEVQESKSEAVASVPARVEDANSEKESEITCPEELKSKGASCSSQGVVASLHGVEQISASSPEMGSKDVNPEIESVISSPESSSQGVESTSASPQGVEPISASSPDVGSKHVNSEIESIKTCLEEVKSKEATSSQEVKPSISASPQEGEPTSASSPEVGSKDVNPELESEITNPESKDTSSHEVGSISASLEPEVQESKSGAVASVPARVEDANPEKESEITCLEELKSKGASCSSQRVVASLQGVENISASSPEMGSKDENPEIESVISSPESSSPGVGSSSAQGEELEVQESKSEAAASASARVKNRVEDANPEKKSEIACPEELKCKDASCSSQGVKPEMQESNAAVASASASNTNGSWDSPVDRGETTSHPTPEKNIRVIFHILIPKKEWGWTEDSRVCLMFKHSGWENGVGKLFKEKREINNFSEVECHYEMDIDVLCHGVTYKYCVTSSPCDDMHESLRGLKYRSSQNRYLRINQQGGEFHQYDSVTYPGQSILQKSYNLIIGQRQDILDKSSMQALRIYLKEHKERLCDFASLNAEIATTDILDIFHSLRYVRICDRNHFERKELIMVMQEFLFEIVEELSKISINDAISNGKRMSSAIVIICCLHKMEVTKRLSCPQRSKLFSLLYMMPDIKQKKCEDWELPSKFYSKILCENSPRRFISFHI